MKTISRTTFTTVKTEGGILPADLLQRIAEGRDLEGLRPEDDYHLFPGERLNEAINRAWNRCLGAWRAFDVQRARLPESDRGTTLTRDRWLLILFHELGYGRLQYAGSLSIAAADHESRNTDHASRYPISHLWDQTPIHLTTFRQELDRRGIEKRSPHSLMQEFLNRSDDHLWGFVSNGLRLRVLRDNVSLTRAAYVEFDLEAMMTGEQYADFAILWLVCHQSRVEGPTPEQCWLERWSKTAAEQGVRALDALRGGVQEAIVALGRGFLAHRANTEMRERLREGNLSGQDYYRQLLRLVYRLIFLFVAEDRDLLLLPDTPPEIQARYYEHYSLQRLRTMAETLRGGPHADLYRSLRLLFGLLREGYPPLGLPALGSFLFSEKSTPDLDGAELDNGSLLEAIRALAFTIERNVRRPVDYRNLGAEELGSVYESLLELYPQINADAATFDLHAAAGSERKTTGSYYTPSSLIHSLLDSALEPVIEDRLAQVKRQTSGVKRQTSNVKSQSDVSRLTFDEPRLTFDDPEEAILSIKVADPACGSGHFLIAAAHRLARHLARARTGDEEPAPAELRAALRDVVRHCIHGVDINPMAVELCKVALWMETLDPGKPLSFLDRNIQCGNSLIGATPALLEQGIPDEAFKPITGDDKPYCREWKKKNQQQREGQLSLFAPDLQPWERLGNLAAGMLNLDGIGEDTLEDVRRKQEMYEELVRSSDYRYGRLWADAWCAAFVWKKTKEFAYPITEEVFRRIERNPFDVVPWMVEAIKRLREQYQFFHWHLAFPQVFRLPAREETPENEALGWSGGFDVVLGNPPWEMQEVKDNEFFAISYPEVLAVKSAKDKAKVFEQIRSSQLALWRSYQAYVRVVHGEKHFMLNSSRYPLSAIGRLNLYRLFLENNHSIINSSGRVGLIIPSGFASDSFSQKHFNELHSRGRLVSLYDFENREGIFSDVHRSYKFCLITVDGKDQPNRPTDFVFFARKIEELAKAERHVPMLQADLRLLNPLTRTSPLFRSKRDREITIHLHRMAPILARDSGRDNWQIKPVLMFMMNASMKAHRSAEELESAGYELAGNWYVKADERWLPLYEGKMVAMYDHRSASIRFDPSKRVRRNQPVPLSKTEHSDPNHFAQPVFWVGDKVVYERCGAILHWHLVVKDITAATNERTAIAAILPSAALTDSVPWLSNPQSPALNACLLANLNSFVFDFAARQKVAGLHLRGHYLGQLPALAPGTFNQQPIWDRSIERLARWVLCRVIELTHTAWDLQPFAQDCGYDGPPFRWDEERRFLLRCELDAAYFHLYSIARDDVDYIMETFPIVKRKDEAAHGEYRTRRVILEIYDAMQRAIEAGEPYQTLLNPPPADPRVAHPQR